MKKILAVFVLVFILQSEMIGQGVDIKFTETKKMAITIGLLNGGGLLGAELETLLSNKLGAHIGVGFVGACVGLDYHLKPTTNSSYFSLELRNQGIGEIYTDTSLGLGFVLRFKGISAQIGGAYILKAGPNTIENWNTGSFVPQVSLGYYSAF